MRSAIMLDRDDLVAQGKQHVPRDSEMSIGQFDDDLKNVKAARIRVQRRFVDGNAVNSSDEEDGADLDQINGQNGGKNAGGQVLHFKRKYKSGAA
mmetsp:Transcript_14993/g.18931  ORF Transcript_14993/g.18931 Transcript_14993/m.18931 type:complete len:95 (-) Transcript_14993:806-1090(-)